MRVQKDLDKLAVSYRKAPSEELFEEILSLSSGNIRSLARKYARRDSEREEMARECEMALMMALESYDQERGGFSGFAWLLMERRCISYLHSETTNGRRMTAATRDAIAVDEAYYSDRRMEADVDGLLAELERPRPVHAQHGALRFAPILTKKEMRSLRAYVKAFRAGKCMYDEAAQASGIDTKELDNSMQRVRLKLRQHRLNLEDYKEDTSWT